MFLIKYLNSSLYVVPRIKIKMASHGTQRFLGDMLNSFSKTHQKTNQDLPGSLYRVR